MKNLKFFSIIAVIAVIFIGVSCSEDVPIVLNNVAVELSYPDDVDAIEGVIVEASCDGVVYVDTSDATGAVTFELPVGTYEFSASETRSVAGVLTSYNAVESEVISETWDETAAISLEMVASTKSQVIIKELYFGGCPTNDGTDTYNYGQYITLYNNSTENVDLQNLCLGSMSTNSYAVSLMGEINEGDTDPYWFAEDWTPAGYGYFYFPDQTILEPGEEIVVAISGGIDHTQTYSNCVDLSNSEYYVCYDIDVYTHALTYPAPSSNIDPSHYLDASKFGLGTAVVISRLSPAMFLFYPEGQTPAEYGADDTDNDYWKDLDNFPRKKVPASWTVDAIDVFAAGREDDNIKRLNPLIDAGYVYMVSDNGYTLYRNVDKDATEAIEGNTDKLVYNYSGGTDGLETQHGTTDPSGIDAEASIANGATIIFMDTNNSGNDFHLRNKSSLKD